MATKPVHRSAANPPAPPPSKQVAKSMSEMSRLMQARVATPQKKK